jgi:hypothetical protein
MKEIRENQVLVLSAGVGEPFQTFFFNLLFINSTLSNIEENIQKCTPKFYELLQETCWHTKQ